MFKRSLTAVAVLGVVAGSALATDVQLYGVLDTGFAYTRVKPEGKDATNVYGMKNGVLSGSRIGVKGTEDVGNGVSVGFVLEGGVDGTNGTSSLFQRESTINVAGGFGKVIAGRMGVLRSSAGSVGMGNIDPLAVGTVIGGFDNIRGGFETRVNNAVAYVSPEFVGTKVYAMYGMGGDSYTNQNKDTSANRYLGLGVKTAYGPLTVVGVVDSFLKTKDAKSEFKAKNEYQVNLGASYDFGAIKPVLQLAYFKNSTKLQNGLGKAMSTLVPTHENEKGEVVKAEGGFLSGFGAQIGAVAPVGPGAVIATLGYARVTAKDALLVGTGEKLGKGDRWNLGVAYAYSLSKRTTLYAGAGFLRTTYKPEGGEKLKGSIYQAGAGIKHTF